MSMKLLLCLLPVLLAVSAQDLRGNLPQFVGLPTADGLTNLFLNSKVTRRDPQTSMACFGGYIIESNVITERYSKAYSGCMSDARTSRRGIGAEFQPIRHKIELSAEGVCRTLTKCRGINDTLESFNCHAAAGSNNTLSTYTISGNASESATLLQERYRIVDLHHEQCRQKAERSYVSATAGNYNYLQACLNGQVKPKPLPKPTTTSTSTTTTTTTTTTEAPTTLPPVDPTSTDSPANVEDQFKQLLNFLK